MRIARHFESQASVRSTTQRRAGCVLRPAVSRFADAADVRDVAGRRAGGLAGRVVVGLVQAEVLRELAGVGSLDHRRFQRGGEQPGVVDVGALDLDPERAAAALYVETLLRAWLGSIGGIRPLFAPPMRALPIIPSTACHSQSRSPSASHSDASAAQISSSTPSSTKRWNQRCTVESSPNSRGN